MSEVGEQVWRADLGMGQEGEGSGFRKHTTQQLPAQTETQPLGTEDILGTY